MQRSDLKILWPFLCFYILLTFFVLHNSFFWDTIQLGSKQAHWFHDHNFKFFFLPEIIDSGHPPSFGIYLAICWKFFGKSLPVSHLAMLPFLLGIVIQVYLLLKKYIQPQFIILTLIVLLADPTIMSQSILVSPDIVFIFFFLLSLNAILADRTIILSLALIGLGMISMRGMMHIAVLFVLDFILHIVFTKRYRIKNLMHLSIPYFPAAMLVGGWLFLHYKETGWIGYHENSPWYDCFRPVTLPGFFKNLFILAWRLIDFGRVFIWLAAIPVLYITIKKKGIDAGTKTLLLFFIVPLLIVTPNLLIHKNLLAHRYIVVLYLTFALLILYQIQRTFPQYFKKIALLLLIGLLTGNFWVYGDTIAKGWDSTLGHYPYYQLRKEMIAYIEKEGLDKSSVGTDFPNNLNVRYTDLSTQDWSFANKDLKANSYVFYSNVFNNFSDEELEELKSWKVMKEITSPTVKVILYKKP
ncbi:MAG: ArnT family glycosyltransferase [Cytophagaceae bacterium]